MNALVMKLAQIKQGIKNNEGVIVVSILATTAGVAATLTGVDRLLEGHMIVPPCMVKEILQDAAEAVVEEVTE